MSKINKQYNPRGRVIEIGTVVFDNLSLTG